MPKPIDRKIDILRLHMKKVLFCHKMCRQYISVAEFYDANTVAMRVILYFENNHTSTVVSRQLYPITFIPLNYEYLGYCEIR